MKLKLWMQVTRPGPNDGMIVVNTRMNTDLWWREIETDALPGPEDHVHIHYGDPDDGLDGGPHTFVKSRRLHPDGSWACELRTQVVNPNQDIHAQICAPGFAWEFQVYRTLDPDDIDNDLRDAGWTKYGDDPDA